MRKEREKIFFSQRSGIVRILFYLNTALWLLLSLNTVVSMIDDNNAGFPIALVAFFLLLNVASLFFGGRLLNQAENWTYIFAIIVVVLNILLTFTGIPELLYVAALVIDGIILSMLISIRGIYFK